MRPKAILVLSIKIFIMKYVIVPKNIILLHRGLIVKQRTSNKILRLNIELKRIELTYPRYHNLTIIINSNEFN